jgi:hypothetical protein
VRPNCSACPLGTTVSIRRRAARTEVTDGDVPLPPVAACAAGSDDLPHPCAALLRMRGRRTNRRSGEETHRTQADCGALTVGLLCRACSPLLCVHVCPRSPLDCPSPSRCGYQPIMCVDCMDGMAMPREWSRVRVGAEKRRIFTEETISSSVCVCVCVVLCCAAVQSAPTPLGAAASIAAACSASTVNPLRHALILVCAGTSRYDAEAVCRVNFASTARIRNGAHSIRPPRPV